MKIQTFGYDLVEPTRDYGAPRRATGVRESRRLSPDGASLWLCDSTFDAGGTIEWDDEHGDDGVFVVEGELEIDGRVCPARGSVIVESGVACAVRARAPTRLVHVGTAGTGAPDGGVLGPPECDDHGVHVVGPSGRFVSGRADAVHAVWFADGTCRSCRIQLFTVHAGAGVQGGGGHSHSEDEIIYVLSGEVRMGAHRYGPGSALSIPADVRYALANGEHGHVFLNYRSGVSEQVYGRGDQPLLETALARGGRVVDDVA